MAEQFSSELTEAEQRLIQCAAEGREWKPSFHGDEKADTDPRSREDWDDNDRLRALVIAKLATGEIWPGEKAPWGVSYKGIRIAGADIVGVLDLEGAPLTRPLTFRGCRFSEEIILRSAKTKSLSFEKSCLQHGLSAEDATIEGSLSLNRGFYAKGEVNLGCTSVSGQVDCSGGIFDNSGHTALQASALIAGADVFLSQGFSALGEVSFVRANIKGQLACDQAKFRNRWGPAFNGDTLTVGTSLLFRNCTVEQSEARLSGAKIGGQLNCKNSKFTNPDGIALNCDNLTTGTDAYLCHGFTAIGQVNFTRASIGGNLFCDDGEFHNPNGVALFLAQAKIGAGLILRSLQRDGKSKRIRGKLMLDQAQCGAFADDETFWPEQGNLSLDGFVYQRFFESRIDWQTRLRWLCLQPTEHLKFEFRPHPWTQAIIVLKSMGHDYDARELAVQREKFRANSKSTPAPMRFWLNFLRYTIGSGYKTHIALYWSLAFVMFGWLTFASAANLGFIGPRDSSVQADLAATKPHVLKRYTRFNAPIYALDAYLPIELGQDASWIPTSTQTGHERAPAAPLLETGRLLLGHDRSLSGASKIPPPNSALNEYAKTGVWLFNLGLHRAVYWLLVIFGWVFVTLGIAGSSGLIRRE
jgi:hypothetical protein